MSVEWEKRDRYGRVVGKVVDSEGDVNLALVRSGMCWWYRKYADEQSDVDRVLYEAAEVSARKGRVGLWRGPESVPPWEWRRCGIYKEWGEKRTPGASQDLSRRFGAMRTKRPASGQFM